MTFNKLILTLIVLALPILAAAQKNEYVATVSFNTDGNATSQTLNETDLESLLDQVDVWTIYEHGLTEAITSRTIGGELFGPARDEYLMYALDGDSGSTLADQVGRADATLSGTTSTLDSLTTTSIVGSGAVEMLEGGTGSYFQVPAVIDDAITTGQDFTLALWWKHKTNASGNLTNDPMLGNFDETDMSRNRITFFTYSDDETYLRVRTTEGNEQYIITGSNDETWRHIALMRDDATFRWYVDGIEKKTDTNATSNTESLDSGIGFYVGKHANYSSGAPGVVDDFRIYKRALSQSEIKGLYNEGSGTASHVGAIRGVDGFLQANQLGLGEVRAEWDTNNDELDLYADDEKFMTIRHRASYEPEFGIGTDAPEAALHVDDSASTPVIISNRDGIGEGQNAFIQFDGAQHGSDTSLYNIVTHGIAGGGTSTTAPGPGDDEWEHTGMIKMGVDNGTTATQVWVPVYEPK